jgi:transposase
MSQKLESTIAVIGIDIGKNSFHIVGHDERGAIVLRQKWSRGQVEARFANIPPCLVGMEACVGAHHLSRKLRALQALHRVRERLVSQRTGLSALRS